MKPKTPKQSRPEIRQFTARTGIILFLIVLVAWLAWFLPRYRSHAIGVETPDFPKAGSESQSGHGTPPR